MKVKELIIIKDEDDSIKKDYKYNEDKYNNNDNDDDDNDD